VLRTLHKICSILLSALGVVHTALTPVFYGRFSLGALWFAGSGLAMIFIGFLNIILSRDAGRDRVVRMLCYSANLITVVFGALIVFLDTEPQVIFGLALIFLMTATAFTLKK
jgi:MFS-type transporter involved in bile tolerance (Atg22 family)